MSEAILSDNSIVREERQAKEWTPAKVIYTCLMAFNLLSFLWLLATGSGIEMSPIIWIARIATAPLAIYLGKLWKDRGFQILSIYTLFFFFRAYISHPENIFCAELSESVFSALWIFAGCYGLGRILSRETLTRLLFIITVIWTIGIVAFSCVGIYAAWVGKTITLWGDSIIDIRLHGRLNIVYSGTTSGAVLCLSALIAMIPIFSKKSRLAKMFFFFSEIPLIIALALTDSRTAYISFSVGIGIIAAITFLQGVSQDKKRKSFKWIIGIIIILVISAIVLICLMQITPLFIRLKTKGIFPVAMAESPEGGLLHRGFSGENIFSGRISLWREVIHCFKQRPILFFVGESKYQPIRIFSDYYAHCHCLYLQILLESGIPGILMILYFIIHTGRAGIRLIKKKGYPNWTAFLLAVTFSFWLGDIAECFIWLRASQCPMIAVEFIFAGILTANASLNRQQKVN